MDRLNNDSFILLVHTMNSLLLWLAYEAFLAYIVPICLNEQTHLNGTLGANNTPKGIFEEGSVILGCGIAADGNWNCVCDSYPCFIPLPPLKDPPPSPKIVRTLRDSPPSPGESYWGRIRTESYEELDEEYGQYDTPISFTMREPYTHLPPLPPSPENVCA